MGGWVVADVGMVLVGGPSGKLQKKKDELLFNPKREFISKTLWVGSFIDEPGEAVLFKRFLPPGQCFRRPFYPFGEDFDKSARFLKFQQLV